MGAPQRFTGIPRQIAAAELVVCESGDDFVEHVCSEMMMRDQMAVYDDGEIVGYAKKIDLFVEDTDYFDGWESTYLFLNDHAEKMEALASAFGPPQDPPADSAELQNECDAPVGLMFGVVAVDDKVFISGRWCRQFYVAIRVSAEDLVMLAGLFRQFVESRRNPGG